MAFDVARGTLGWPEGIDGRGVRNSIVDLHKEGNDIGELRAKYTEGTNRGDPDYMITWAGTGVGDMTQIKGAKVSCNMSYAHLSYHFFFAFLLRLLVSF